MYRHDTVLLQAPVAPAEVAKAAESSLGPKDAQNLASTPLKTEKSSTVCLLLHMTQYLFELAAMHIQYFKLVALKCSCLFECSAFRCWG